VTGKRLHPMNHVHPGAARLLEPLKLEPIALVILHDDTLAGEAGMGMSRAILLRALLERGMFEIFRVWRIQIRDWGYREKSASS